MAFLLGVTSGSLRAPAPPAAPQSEMGFVTSPPDARAPQSIPLPAASAIDRQAAAPGLVNFADVAESLNPAVVNIEATTRAGDTLEVKG